MKILILIGPSIGIARYGIMLAREMNLLAEVKVIIPNNVLIDPFVLQLIKDLDHYIFFKPRGNKLSHCLKSVMHIRRIIKKWKPDIVHDTLGSVFFGYLLFLDILIKYPLCITEHEPYNRHTIGQKNFPKRLLFSLQKTIANHYIVHGPNSKKIIANRKYKESDISILPHGRYDFYKGIETDKLQKESHTILFFGSLRPDKGLEYLPKIAEIVEKAVPQSHFILAGNREWPSSLNRKGWPKRVSDILAKLKIKYNFEVHDYYIPDDQVRTFFERASIVILPYKTASQSGVAAIALPFKCAVVAFDVGDLGYMLKNNNNAILIEPGNIKAFANTLIDLLNNPKLLRGLAQSGYDYSRKNLNWGAIARQTFKIYFNISAR
jgi:glycosyltransferase involved in cell wall biosynthesis